MAGLNKEEYMANAENYGTILWKEKQDPSNGWATPFVIGHKYKIHWGVTGLDFTGMTLDVSERYLEDDAGIYFVHNFTDTRAEMEVYFNGGERIANDSIADTPRDWKTGQHILYEDPTIREFHFIVNGAYSEPGVMTFQRQMKVIARRCPGGECAEVPLVVSEIEDTPRFWSQERAWADAASGEELGTIPGEGEEVTIASGWNMHLDLEEDTPIFEKLIINGRLTFKQGMNHHLRAKIIFIRGGELRIGTKAAPYTDEAKITLIGEKNDVTLVLADQGVEGGNKVIANLGKITMYGKKRSFKLTRLRAAAKIGDTKITVEPENVDLVKDDRIALAATSFAADTGEMALVEEYDPATGVVTLQSALKDYHFGAEASTAEQYNGVDIRGEVVSLSRNIKIVGGGPSSWGGHIVTTDIVENDGTLRAGELRMDSVELDNLGQADTEKAALRFEDALTFSHEVRNCGIHSSNGWGLNSLRSRNIVFDNNAMFGFRKAAVSVEETRALSFTNNFAGHIQARSTTEGDGTTLDKHGGVLFGSL
jgi:cell migration-inducing and hyaluronan-binding protein